MKKQQDNNNKKIDYILKTILYRLGLLQHTKKE